MRKAVMKYIQQYVVLLSIFLWMLGMASAQSLVGSPAFKASEGRFESKPPSDLQFPGVDPPPITFPRVDPPPDSPWLRRGESMQPKQPKAYDHLNLPPKTNRKTQDYPFVDPPPN